MSNPATLEDQWIQSVVDRYQGPLTAYATKLVGNQRAGDVVQDTFLKLCRQDRAQVEGRLAAWLYTVCRNRALDVLRHDGRLRLVDSSRTDQQQSAVPLPVEVAARRQEAKLAIELLSTLPPRQQELVRLKFQHGLSYREISEITNLSVSNVGYLLHMSIKALRTKMKARGHQGDGQGETER